MAQWRRKDRSEHPLAHEWTSPNFLRLAAAKLLLYKKAEQQAQVGVSPSKRIQWPGEGAARLAAIMFVLFVLLASWLPLTLPLRRAPASSASLLRPNFIEDLIEDLIADLIEDL